MLACFAVWTFRRLHADRVCSARGRGSLSIVRAVARLPETPQASPVAGGGPRVTVVSRPPWLSCRSRRTSRRSTR